MILEWRVRLLMLLISEKEIQKQVLKVTATQEYTMDGAPDYPLSDPEKDNENLAFLQERLNGENVCVNKILSILIQ